MTDTDIRYAPPVECMPWCSSGDGHPTEIHYCDQNCYSANDYMYLPLNGRYKQIGGEDAFGQIGISAKREVGFLPVVHMHLMLADAPYVDVGVKFTVEEARWLAGELLKVAELIGGGAR